MVVFGDIAVSSPTTDHSVDARCWDVQ